MHLKVSYKTIKSGIGTNGFYVRFISSPEPKALGELIGWDWSRRPSVRASIRASVNPFTLQTGVSLRSAGLSRSFFYLEHHFGRRIDCIRLDRIKSLVSMAKYSSHRVIMGEFL